MRITEDFSCDKEQTISMTDVKYVYSSIVDLYSSLRLIRFEQRWSNKQLQKLLNTEHIRQHLIEVGLVG